MPTDLTIALFDRPGTLAQASDVLGRAGINIDGAAGYICDGRGVYHVLVQEAERAKRALIDAGFEIADERHVVLAEFEKRPGSAAAVLRRIADVELNIDLLYMTEDGRLVLSGPDVDGIRRALGD